MKTLSWPSRIRGQIRSEEWRLSHSGRPGSARRYTLVDRERLLYVKQEYQELVREAAAGTSFTLRDAFDCDDFSIVDYCRNFNPNPVSVEVQNASKVWAGRFNLWIPGISEYCYDVMSYLYPSADLNRLSIIGRLFAVNWYINDTFGREQIANSGREKEEIYNRARRLVKISETMTVPADSTLVEQACLEALNEIHAAGVPENWFSQFRERWVGHLQMICRDSSNHSQGLIPTTEEYLLTGTYRSGTQHLLTLSEFAQNRFLDWGMLHSHGLTNRIRRIWWLAAVISGGSNDIFSFEKECIECSVDSNMIILLILNKRELSLRRAIALAMSIIRNQMVEFMEHVRFLYTWCENQPTTEDGIVAVQAFLQSREWNIMTDWLWQVLSKRYKRHDSIFVETRL